MDLANRLAGAHAAYDANALFVILRRARLKTSSTQNPKKRVTPAYSGQIESCFTKK
jgi:hypothetical protein